MLTINADHDPLFKHYNTPNKEKRMVVILPEGAYNDWLTASADQSRDSLVPFPSDRLLAIQCPDVLREFLPPLRQTDDTPQHRPGRQSPIKGWHIARLPNP